MQLVELVPVVLVVVVQVLPVLVLVDPVASALVVAPVVLAAAVLVELVVVLQVGPVAVVPAVLGSTRDHVLSMEVVLAGGARLELSQETIGERPVRRGPRQVFALYT